MISEETREQIRKHLIVDEGLRLKPYWDCCGLGLRAQCTKNAGPHRGKLTIGIGRNLEDVGLTALESHYLCDNNITRSLASLVVRYPWFADQDEVRQAALIELDFNMGSASLAGFVRTLAAFEAKDYPAAAAGLRASHWFRQVQPSRSARIIGMVLKGAWS